MPRAASCPPTGAVALPRPIGPRTASISQVSVSVVARLDDALEPAVVDAGEERDLAAVLLLDEHGDRAGLRHRLDDQHARHHRARRESAPETTSRPRVRPGVATTLAARLELDHLVEQQERVAVRQDPLDLVPPERCLGDHPADPASSSSRIAARPRWA